MKSFIEPFILYWVLFLRIPAGITPGEGAAGAVAMEFSWTAEIARIFIYTLPSLALVWYLVLKKVKSLKATGIRFPQKKDFVVAFMAFCALTLIGVTISLVSAKFGEAAMLRQSLSPRTVTAWAVLVVSCISSAYLEESYFRFYLFSRKEEMGLGPHRAVLVSTLLFSICHIYEGPLGFLNAALSGVVLADVFLRFRSLHGVAAAHALYNILAYVLQAGTGG
ncbi:MAG: CPBP family intramembrane metalloprotease [Treponema sp.]|jgi:membrane protease YdiL (CAAX protease family)|nr:CPBP family intramembrane metalloprotease [Treponema sp.]